MHSLKKWHEELCPMYAITTKNTTTTMNIVIIVKAEFDANLHGTQSHVSWQKRGQPLGQRCESPGLISKHTKQYM